MGWASGAMLLSEVVEIIKENVDDVKVRKSIYEGLISAFEGFDADTLDECCGEDSAFDEVYKTLNPPDDDDWVDDDPDLH